MFQNIIDEEIKEEESFDTDKKKRVINLKGLFSVSDFVLYAISFMVSMVSFNGEFAPFGLAIFASVCSNRIPLGIVYIATVLGTLIGFGANGFLSYLLTTLLFIVMTLIFRPRSQEDRNEKQKLGLYIFLSAFMVQAGKMFFTMFLVYDLLASFVFAILTYIFYKIFANSITVIKEYGIKKAFTVEEVMGASLLLAIAFYSMNGLNIFGLSISNILSIMIVLFLGWKYGMLVGATAGITIGMVLGIIGSSSPVLIASYAISGMIAGILNKLGKIGVIVGFALGNAVLTYVVNGNTVPVITIREILIASLGLLLLPKYIDIDISDIVGKSFVFPTMSDISISIFFGSANKPNDAINISLIVITGTVLPFTTYVRTAFPKANPTITPIFPSLFSIPAIIPDIAYDAIRTGLVDPIIPSTIPIVIPAVAPTSIPYFQPKKSTNIILKILLIDNPNTFNALIE